MKAVKSIQISALLLIFVLSGCALLKGNKKPVKLVLRYSSEANINYGSSFNLETFIIYSNNKEKEVTGKDELTIGISGASYRKNGTVSIDSYPTKLSSNTISVSASYVKEDISLQTQIDIPFNYKGNIQLHFDGRDGEKGTTGDKGSTALLFRDGKEGGVGGNGTSGSSGDNLTVYVWKDSVDFYFFKVQNLKTSVTYIYKIKDRGYSFSLNATGGQGGKGGEGGNGGDGKDGSVSDDKVKDPGDGGKGGMGGNGGNGGNGGDVYVFIHPNAADIQPRVTTSNYGGTAGAGGDGGKGGKAGTPATGQTAASDGTAGASGTGGYSGSNGNFQVLVEAFDIEY
jgi:hypothetical protein